MDIFLLSVVGGIGLALLLLAVVLDGVFDFFGSEPVIPGIAFFVTIFGFVGALVLSVTGANGLGVLGVVGSAVAAIAASGLFFVSYRALRKHADADELQTPELDRIVGELATVDFWTDGAGRVHATWLGQRRPFHATSEDDLRPLDSVVITRVAGDSLVVAKF